jgi:hypothetical protein
MGIGRGRGDMNRKEAKETNKEEVKQEILKYFL